MPAQQRRDEVGGAKEVEGAGEGDAGEAVQARRVPGYLRPVDGEMRGDGTVAALVGEEGVGFFFSYGGSGGRAGGSVGC